MTRTYKVWWFALLVALTVGTVVDAVDEPVNEQGIVLRSDDSGGGQTIVTMRSFELK